MGLFFFFLLISLLTTPPFLSFFFFFTLFLFLELTNFLCLSCIQRPFSFLLFFILEGKRIWKGSFIIFF